MSEIDQLENDMSSSDKSKPADFSNGKFIIENNHGQVGVFVNGQKVRDLEPGELQADAAGVVHVENNFGQVGTHIINTEPLSFGPEGMHIGGKPIK